MPEDLGIAAPELWACHCRAVDLFDAMGTQWRNGMGGPTGLDYGVLRDVFEFRDVPRADWAELFEEIRIIELAAIDEIYRE